MQFYLMHHNVPTAVLEVAEQTGDIIGLASVLDESHMPYGSKNKQGKFDILSIRAWWAHRSIPLSRAGLERAMRELGVVFPELLVFKSLGLSLSDHYWITSVDNPPSWEKVNFFQNDFSEDVGKALFAEPIESVSANLHSPCNTADGMLKKRWTIKNGKRRLLKAGSGIYRQEPFNEVVATELFLRMGIPCVKYRLENVNGEYVSSCPCFTDESTEFVSASEFLNVIPQEKETSNWLHFCNCIEYLNIPDGVDFIVKLLAADFILGNTDRHFGNFGALRNSTTLKWLGMAPAFDTGNCLWYMTKTQSIDPYAFIPAQPFATSQEAQWNIVREKFRTDSIDSLDEFDGICEKILSQNPENDDGRAHKIAQAVKMRIALYKTMQKNQL